MRFAVIAFPGSNCELDSSHPIEDVIKEKVDYVWYKETDLSKYDCIILPGGFSYGDYLRSGAIAKLDPIIKAIEEAAKQGKYILGISNGFQILLEAGLLPGAMIINEKLKFICESETIIVNNNQTAFTNLYQQDEEIIIPIAHGVGSYYCDKETLAGLQNNNQIILKYKNNPNGSIDDIAGIINKQGNVMGMMPHPERAIYDFLGTIDGQKIFLSIIKRWREKNDAS